MDKFLVDVNVVLDAVFKRNLSSIAIIERLVECGAELYITASMAPTLDYFLKKHKVDKKKFKEKFLESFKIITSTGKEGAEAIECEDGEDALIALSFKRVCPDGIIVTRDGKFGTYGLPFYTPDELLRIIEDKQSDKKLNIPVLDLKKQYRYMLEDIDDAVLKCVAGAKYILGPEVKQLEDKVAEYLGVKHCIGVSSGTDALVLSLRSLAIKLRKEEYWNRDDLIITTPFSFTATGDAIFRAGATPLFVDIDPFTYNIDPQRIRHALSSLPSASNIVGIIPIHLYGQSCQMDEIMKIAEEYGLFVVEDVAQAFGEVWHGSAGSPQKLGSIGTAGAFSFFPSKPLGGYGDGGMVATSDNEIAELVRMLLRHGGKDKYNVDHIGYNARLDTLQAAVLLAKFKYIDEFNEKRRKIAKLYNEGLKDLEGLVLPSAHSSLPFAKNGHIYHQYTVKINNGKRNEIQKYLKEKGISAMVYYPFPLHKMKVFEGKSKMWERLDGAELATQSVLSLPIEPLQSEADTA